MTHGGTAVINFYNNDHRFIFVTCLSHRFFVGMIGGLIKIFLYFECSKVIIKFSIVLMKHDHGFS